MNKNTDSYLLVTSLRVCLVIADCFGVAPHKWEDHKLVLRYRRSSAFLHPGNIFIPACKFNGRARMYSVFVLNEA